jgi:hypothetical protein
MTNRKGAGPEAEGRTKDRGYNGVIGCIASKKVG